MLDLFTWPVVAFALALVYWVSTMARAKKAVPGLEDFVDRLVTEKGMTNLDPEVLAQVKKDLLDRVEDRVNAVIIEKLPPESLEDFERLLDGGDEKEIQAFCQTQIPDLDQKIAAELLAFRQTYLNP